MQKIVALLSLAVISATSAIAQKRAYPIRWEESPKLHTISKDFAKSSAVFVLDERRAEFVSDPTDKEIYLFRTLHRIIHLTDEKGVESFNRFALPTGNSTRLVSVKARSIAPSGKVIEVGREQVKEIKNSEGQPEYLLAVEGVEKGGEVELLYTEKRPYSSFGSELMQYSIPVMQSEFMLILPTHLVYDMRGYNGYPSAKDSVDIHNSDNHIYTARQTDIPAIKEKEEQYSNYKAFLRRLDYKLSYIKGDKGDVRMNTWSELASGIYSRYYNFTDKEQRIAEDFTFNTIGVKAGDDEVTKIQKIEDYLKTNIAMSESLDEENDKVASFGNITGKKLTTEQGFVRFFCACLTAAGVKHELGLGTSKYDRPSDDSLEMWSGLDLYAIYFPKENKYITPSGINMRYPFYPVGLVGSKAIFSKPTSLGGMTKGLPDIRVLPPLPVEASLNNIDADISFESGTMVPVIDLTKSFTGYEALGMREAFIYTPKEKEPELLRGVMELAAKPEDVVASDVKGTAYTNYYTGKPLALNMKFKAPALMDKAGPKYLFKVGDIIGRQAEMYSAEKRMLPINIQYAHQYNRTINITVPAGYKIVNPEAVKLNVVQNYAGSLATKFVSDYTMEGNVMKIRIQEDYRVLEMPVTEYEQYRKVVNAAADFNKVVLVLQKQ